jgi:precorrin-6A/cobalt-precorrin-6A reductase
LILLLGGTSDAAPIASRLVREGYRVLVSRATDIPLETGAHPDIESRSGPLDERGLAELIDRRGIRAIVDATHPYAVVIHAAASQAAAEKGIPYLHFVRPAAVDAITPGVEFALDHAAAAVAAFRRGRPVLLTTGTRNLAPYVEQARRAGIHVFARVLDLPQSRVACQRAGIPADHVLLGRGPFSVEDNRRHIRAFGIGVLVTKDSGAAGGTAEKIEAARAEGCDVIVISRPAIEHKKNFDDIDTLIAALVYAFVQLGLSSTSAHFGGVTSD